MTRRQRRRHYQRRRTVERRVEQATRGVERAMKYGPDWHFMQAMGGLIRHKRGWQKWGPVLQWRPAGRRGWINLWGPLPEEPDVPST